ncbi:MAG TPA: sigma-70 family RNA polymerase sigma factor [Eudoraea sp.]|nr:sigma-70 family RNA polymerase sigma factor [Eudoraea sp.]
MDLKIEIEQVYKESYGQLKTILKQKFNFLTLDMVEDLIQEAFSQAMDQWPQKGMPRNPSGWLYQCCRNNAIDLIQRSNQNVQLSENEVGHTEKQEVFKNQIKDGRLKTLFDCCHPDLTSRTQIVLALKYVIGFRTGTIAQQFGISGDAVEKMLYRTRQELKLNGLPQNDLSIASYKERLSSVHKVIYLIFTEGWKNTKATKKDSLEMIEEALILNTELIHNSLGDSNTLALQALLLFNIARFKSRFDIDGKPIHIELQNRDLWNPELIRLGHNYLVTSESDALSSFHLEAAIAYKHCAAKSFSETDWETICQYYDVLLKVHPNPFVEINYAIALYYNGHLKQAHDRFSNLKNNRYLNSSKLLKNVIEEFNMKTIFSL